jgi:membrane-bound serine protease (ClpP class)
MLMLGSLIMIMAPAIPMPDNPGDWAPSMNDILFMMKSPVKNLGLSLSVIFLAGAVMMRFLPESRLAAAFKLKESISKEDGYHAVADMSSMIGKEGITLTALRPSGIAVFEDQRLDVTAGNHFIDINTPVRIVHTESLRVVVEPVSKENIS